jgi:hypothetical protein
MELNNPGTALEGRSLRFRVVRVLRGSIEEAFKPPSVAVAGDVCR